MSTAITIFEDLQTRLGVPLELAFSQPLGSFLGSNPLGANAAALELASYVRDQYGVPLDRMSVPDFRSMTLPGVAVEIINYHLQEAVRNGH